MAPGPWVLGQKKTMSPPVPRVASQLSRAGRPTCSLFPGDHSPPRRLRQSHPGKRRSLKEANAKSPAWEGFLGQPRKFELKGTYLSIHPCPHREEGGRGKAPLLHLGRSVSESGKGFEQTNDEHFPRCCLQTRNGRWLRGV